MTRHYYAELSPYGTGTLSAEDELYRFDSREERDEFVSRINERSTCGDRCQAVTTRQVAHRYNVGDFDDPDRSSEELWDVGCPLASIHHRPNYEI